jgi:hypothetical protein
MTPTQKFWNYFKPICAAIEGVVYVEISDGDRMDRFRADSTGQDVYPGIFVIRPRYQGQDNFSGQQYAIFDLVFYVLTHADMDTYINIDQYQVINDAFNSSERIAIDIEKVLRHDPDIMFDFNQWRVEPVSYVTLDNSWGVEVKAKIMMPVSELVC